MENYQVICEVGYGSFGSVFKSRDLRSGRIVAIKKHFYSCSNVWKSPVYREYSILTDISHDHIVKVLDIFDHDGYLHGVYEYLDHTVFDELKQNHAGLDEITLKRYIYQVLKAVDFLHQNNIFHRDIKPDNFLVSHSGVLKLADFGDARLLSPLTKCHTPKRCTRGFGSPERILRDLYGKPADVWAIGCSILLMAKCKYFLGCQTEWCEIDHVISEVGPLTKQQEELYLKRFGKCAQRKRWKPKPLSEKYGVCDSALADLVEKCLQTDPEKRASCSELLGHHYFTRDCFPESFLPEIQLMLQSDRIFSHQLAIKFNRKGKSKLRLKSIDEKLEVADKDITLLCVTEDHQRVDEDNTLLCVTEDHQTVDEDNTLLCVTEDHQTVDEDNTLQSVDDHQRVDEDNTLQSLDGHQKVDEDNTLQSVDDHQRVDEDNTLQSLDDHQKVDEDNTLQRCEISEQFVNKSTMKTKGIKGVFRRALNSLNRFLSQPVSPENNDKVSLVREMGQPAEEPRTSQHNMSGEPVTSDQNVAEEPITLEEKVAEKPRTAGWKWSEQETAGSWKKFRKIFRRNKIHVLVGHD